MHIIFAGGGTGGHIFPAIAVANQIKTLKPEVSISFVGAVGGMEIEKVPQAGYPIDAINISGIQRKKWWKNLILPLKIIRSLIQAQKILKHYQPAVVIGTGGYVSGPILFAASRKGIPIVLIESNAFPGITNKWLKNKANLICVGSKAAIQYFPKEKCIYTGNPVRSDISGQKKQEGLDYFHFSTQKKTVLVIGGSLGAGSINKAIASGLNTLMKQPVQIIWQTGKVHYTYYQHYEKQYPEQLRVVPFIQDMNLAYSAADIIISRAGAISLAELAIVQKATILVPSPNVAENHQFKNAKEFADENAAVLIPDAQVQEDLVNEILNLISHEVVMQTLSNNIIKFARPHATYQIATKILELMNLYSKL
ncbi:MAG: undecaprenyldiphospho-muramoylpentapeptide beta-N-acetylglucosaminyltransferase [Bacteroidia bacterium]|nr:undecaprenyldiphospho-muramoylpentapeptide beta-N-acetylglucosaminyltransferase [Bacteroidia bacterium]MDW8348558.1 undecaprenyldiphospho-muramoylpentapeptide beta-N-acetylglucosaminyltransferase [Bacteroidia bacterium]